MLKLEEPCNSNPQWAYFTVMLFIYIYQNESPDSEQLLVQQFKSLTCIAFQKEMKVLNDVTFKKRMLCVCVSESESEREELMNLCDSLQLAESEWQL